MLLSFNPIPGKGVCCPLVLFASRILLSFAGHSAADHISQPPLCLSAWSHDEALTSGREEKCYVQFRSFL